VDVHADAAALVTDGETAITETTAGKGHQTVNIAPFVGGVSHSTYKHFNLVSIA
jgi:hypothetical protein